jgi:transglutaminase-like putative cysteine protease/tetratricopeptide (TPR) repeat protein
MSPDVRHPRFVLLLCLAASLLSVGSNAGAATAAAPAEAPPPAPFTIAPRALLELASAQPAPQDSAIEVLLDVTDVAIDADGRESWLSHLIYRVLDARSAHDGWKEVSADWTAWLGERPVIDARVVTPDSVEHRLDPKLLQEGTEVDRGTTTYSDSRVLRAPLPSIVDGAVVEQTVRQMRWTPFRSGTMRRFGLQGSVPIRRLVVRVTAPASSPLRALVTDATWALERHRRGNLQTLLLDVPATPGLKNDEKGSPRDFPPAPSLWITTTPSWQMAAAEDSDIVDHQLARSDLRALAHQVIGDTRDARIAANRVLAWMRPLRYTSVNFAETSIVPRTPDETLRRQFGDCKDLSALVVGMLRAAGFEAWTASVLVDGVDNIEAMPGLTRFDHVIVSVGGPDPFWIDATAFRTLPAGVLPALDQGRMALVASPGTTRLERLPFASPEINHESVGVRVELAAVGPGSVVETHVAGGSLADEHRPRGPSATAKEREVWEKRAKDLYDASTLTNFQAFPTLPSEPARLEFRVAGARKVWTSVESARFVPAMSRALEDLPGLLTAETDPERTPPRKTPLAVEPHALDVEYVIVPPEGFVARRLSRSFKVALGPATLARTESIAADGSVHVRFRFRLPVARLEPGEVEAFRRALRELRSSPEEPVVLDAAVTAALERGQVQDAVGQSRQLIRSDPSNPLHHVRLARVYLGVGLGEQARVEAERAVDLAPESPDAWGELANVRSHDLFGRRFGEGWDGQGAARALRRALELRYERSLAAQLAGVLERAPNGARFGPGSRLAEALAVYAEYREHEKRHDLDAREALVALRAGERQRALRLIESLEPGSERDRLRLVAVALEEGAEAAERDSRLLDLAPTGQADALEAAAIELATMREYSLARRLAAAAGRAAPAGRDDALAFLLARAERAEERKDGVPEATVRRMLAGALLGVELPADSHSPTVANAIREQAQRAYGAHFRDLAEKYGSTQVAMDLLQGTIELATRRGPGGGWVVKTRTLVGAGGTGVWTLSREVQPRVVAIAGAGNRRPSLDGVRLVREGLAFTDASLEEALQRATARVWSTQREDADALATLGLVHVARGDLVRAHALVIEAMSLRAGNRPGRLESSITARTAEVLGLDATAHAAMTETVRAE